MNTKLQAVQKFYTLESKRHDILIKQLASLRQKQRDAEQYIESLIVLRRHLSHAKDTTLFSHQEHLINRHRANLMVSKYITHQENEQAIKKAENTTLEKQLIGNEARLKGLEKVMQKWHAEYLAERDYAEQIALEEAVNNILACKRC